MNPRPDQPGRVSARLLGSLLDAVVVHPGRSVDGLRAALIRLRDQLDDELSRGRDACADLIRHPRWDWLRCVGLPVLSGKVKRIVYVAWTGSNGDARLSTDEATTARLLATILHESVGGERACQLIASEILRAWGSDDG